jgi:hypothetical protein
MKLSIVVSPSGADLENLSLSEAEGGDGPFAKGVTTLMDWLEGNLLASDCKRLDSAKVQQMMIAEIDTDALQVEMDKVPDSPPMFYGSRLLTDNRELLEEVRALCGTNPICNDQEAFRERWDFLIPVVHQAFRDLGRKDLQAAEIHVMGGRVRAMASADFGRQDSGWLDVPSPSA